MKFDFTKKATAGMNDLLKRSGSLDYETAVSAQRQLAKALSVPLKRGVLEGDITFDIYTKIIFEDGQYTEFPLDFLTPGSEKSFIAYTIPNTGRIPEQHVEGDYVMVPTYDVGASIDTSLKYLRYARWDVMARMLQVLEGMFVRKKNVDAWRTLIAAGAGRNIVTYDDQATAGLFTPRVVRLMETVLRRNAGGNTMSLIQGKLTDLYVSPESRQDALSWDLTQIPDAVRTRIYDADGVTKIGQVKLHDLIELGVGQVFEAYYENTLGGTLPTDKTEIVVGLDLQHRDSFVHPVRVDVEIFEDPNFHRQRRAGMYGFAEHGFGVLDSRRILLGAV